MKKITLFSVLMVLFCFITGILGACSGKGDHNESSDNGTRIQMSFDGQTIYGTLNDNSVSRDLISRLPLTLEFSDYSGTEKNSLSSRWFSRLGYVRCTYFLYTVSRGYCDVFSLGKSFRILS